MSSLKSNEEWYKNILKQYRLKDDAVLFFLEENSCDELKKIYDDFGNKKEKYSKIEKYYYNLILEKINDVDFYLKSRIKDKEHLIVKIIRDCEQDLLDGIDNKKINVTNYENVFSDLIGIRIICIHQEDQFLILDKLLKIIKINRGKFYSHSDSRINIFSKRYNDLIDKNIFTVHKRDEETPYESIHVNTSDNEYGIKIEIQIRTFFEEAWGEVDHSLKYPYDMNNEFLKTQMSILYFMSFAADNLISSSYRFKEEIIKTSKMKKIILNNKHTIKEIMKVFGYEENVQNDYKLKYEQIKKILKQEESKNGKNKK